MNRRTSVIIPTYMASAFIRDTLESVFTQTVLPEEVIVVDDCSSDATGDIVSDCMRSAPSAVRLIRLAQNTGGPAIPLNTGIDAARTEYIATLDQDDSFLPDKLRRIESLFASNPDIDLIIHDANTKFPDNSICYRPGAIQKQLSHFVEFDRSGLLCPSDISIRRAVSAGTLSGCSGMVFRKRVWERVNGFDPSVRSAIDWDFQIRALRASRFGILLDPLFIYSWHELNLSNRKDYERERLVELTAILSRALNSAIDPIERKTYSTRISDIYYDIAWSDIQHKRSFRALRNSLNSAKFNNSRRGLWLALNATSQFVPGMNYFRERVKRLWLACNKATSNKKGEGN